MRRLLIVAGCRARPRRAVRRRLPALGRQPRDDAGRAAKARRRGAGGARAQYYRPVPEKVLQLGSVDEIISALGDPYTAYLAPTGLQARAAGDGVDVHRHRHQRAAVAARASSSSRCGRGPALQAGVRVGDTIVRIGGVRAARLSMAWRGRPHPRAARHDGSPRADTAAATSGSTSRVRRAIVQAPAVHARLLSYAGRRWGDVAASRVPDRRGGRARPRAARARAAAARRGFVLDLRQNPGGLLDQAVAVSSLFLDRGVVVSLAARTSRARCCARPAAVATRLPLVVLVDRYSASSAEIVAAALRDHHRATHRRRADVRQGARAVDRPARQRRGARADDRPLHDAVRRGHLRRRRRAADPRGRQPAHAQDEAL